MIYGPTTSWPVYRVVVNVDPYISRDLAFIALGLVTLVIVTWFLRKDSG